jgi:hypothetical protein
MFNKIGSNYSRFNTPLIHELILINSEIVEDNCFGDNQLDAVVCERKLSLQMDVQLLKHIIYIQLNLVTFKRV